MILILYLLIFSCIQYFLYIKKQYKICFYISVLFFLWFGWQITISSFINIHEPILTTLISNNNNDNDAINIDNSISNDRYHHQQQQIIDTNTNNNNNDGDNNNNSTYIQLSSASAYPITLNTNNTNIQQHILPTIIKNKNRITTNSNLGKANVHLWSSTLNDSGIWSDIDYSSGCAARTAYWPARQHLERLVSMASVWYDKQQDKILLEKVMQGLNFWFDNDYTNDDCTMSGGKSYKNCPCGTPGLWNIKWYSQVIAIPRFIGNICLLAQDQLSTQQKEHCVKFTSRSYSLVNQHGGSNLLDVVYNGISLALLENNTLILQDALDRACKDAFISPAGKDGIQMDGSYLYHDYQLYNGNYGEIYLINLVSIFDMMYQVNLWSPPGYTRQVFTNLLIGSEWMMIGYNLKNSKYSSHIQSPLLWQYGSLGRMISFKTDDLQNTAGVILNITQIEKVTKNWTALPVLNDYSTTTNNKTYTLSTTVRRLKQPYSSANQGKLLGTKYFYNSEYLVHRCNGFVTTLKLLSNRTTTSECVNNQNKLGTHLNDGSLFTYQRGDEYLDVFGAWDWYKVPGTTVNKNVSITCSKQRYLGKESFVGAATLENKQMGVAVMNFTDPRSSFVNHKDDFIGWQKSFFFFPSMYAVHIDMIPSTPNTNASTSTTAGNNHTGSDSNNKNKNLYMTTLDQKRKNGDVLIDGKIVRNPNGMFDQVTSLWHDRILYTFDRPLQINLDTRTHQSDWSSIGVSKGNESIQLFSATIDTYNKKKKGNKTISNNKNDDDDNEPLLSWSYIVQPNFGIHQFQHDFAPPIEFIEMGQVKGAFSPADRAVGLVFWAPGSVEIPWDGESEDEDANFVYIETIDPLLVFLQQQGDGTWMLSVSDPTQKLVSTLIKVSVDQEEVPIQHHIDLPQGQFLGSSVIKILEDEP